MCACVSDSPSPPPPHSFRLHNQRTESVASGGRAAKQQKELSCSSTVRILHGKQMLQQVHVCLEAVLYGKNISAVVMSPYGTKRTATCCVSLIRNIS